MTVAVRATLMAGLSLRTKGIDASVAQDAFAMDMKARHAKTRDAAKMFAPYRSSDNPMSVDIFSFVFFKLLSHLLFENEKKRFLMDDFVSNAFACVFLLKVFQTLPIVFIKN